MAAIFLQRLPPGTPIPGVGFIQPGQFFEAPENFIPANPALYGGAHLPMNEEAQALIERFHKVKVPIVNAPAEEPKKGDTGLTLADLGKMQAVGTGVTQAKQPAPSKGSDRKL